MKSSEFKEYHPLVRVLHLVLLFFFHVFFHVFFFRDFTSMIVYDHEILRRIHSRCLQNEIFQYDFCIAIDPSQRIQQRIQATKKSPWFFRVSYMGDYNKPSIRIPIKLTSTMGSERFFFCVFFGLEITPPLSPFQVLEHFSHFHFSCGVFACKRLSIFDIYEFQLFRLNNYKRSMNHGILLQILSFRSGHNFQVMKKS